MQDLGFLLLGSHRVFGGVRCDIGLSWGQEQRTHADWCRIVSAGGPMGNGGWIQER